jgi:hypothetical protein
MRYEVIFESDLETMVPGEQVTHYIDTDFPALAARIAAEQSNRTGPCTVHDTGDGSLSRWMIDKLESWYARPLPLPRVSE